MAKANIDDILYNTINEHSEEIKIPPIVTNNIYHEINKMMSIGKTQDKRRLRLHAILRYSIVALIALMLGLSYSKLPLNSSKSDIKSDSVKNEYIKLTGASISNTSIDKLYPKYIPDGFELINRYVLDDGKRIELYFTSSQSHKIFQRFTVTLLSYPSSDVSKDFSETLELSSGLAYLKASYIKDNIIDSGRLFIQLDTNLIAIIDVANFSKDDLIKVANSIQVTDASLPDTTNDARLMKMVDSKLFGSDYSMITLQKAIILVKELNLPYTVVQTNVPTNKDTLLTGFTIKDGVVYLFPPYGKDYKSTISK